MKVDLRSPSSHPVAEMVAFAKRCEEAGFWGCGFNDSQMFFRDTYVVMSQVLANTTRLHVHPALTCPGPKHTSVIASAAKTVQELGPDRFELWLGRGNAAAKQVALQPQTFKEMRRDIIEIQRVMAGEAGVYGGKTRLHHGGGQKIRTFMTGRGPLSVKMAAELCDGVLLAVPPTPEGLKQGRAWVAEGAARAGKRPEDVEEVLEMRCLVRNTRKEAFRAWSPILVRTLAAPNAEEWLKQRGIEYDIRGLKPKLHEAERFIESLYPSGDHAEDWDAAVRAASVIPEELQALMGDKMAVLGDPDYVLKRIQELGRWGVKRLYMYPVLTFQLPEEERRAFQQVIGPALAKSGN